MIKTCSECPSTFDTRDRSSVAKTCSDECASKRSLQRVRAYRKANPDTIREYNRQYQKANAHKYREYQRTRHARIGGKKPRRYWPLLRERDGDLCSWCKQSIDFGNPTSFEVDHWHPILHGGSNDLDNLSCMHATCNHIKNATWPLPPPPWKT